MISKIVPVLASLALLAASVPYQAAEATPPTGTAQIVGTWTAPDIGDITKIVIKANATGTVVTAQVSSGCCNLGTARLFTFSSAVGSNVVTGFNSTAYVCCGGDISTKIFGYLVPTSTGNSLIVTDPTTFGPGDSRLNFEATQTFTRIAP